MLLDKNLSTNRERKRLRRFIINLFLILSLFLQSFLFPAVQVHALTSSWDFSTAAEYSYDNTKIEFLGGQAKLKPTSNPNWYNSAWGYRKKITIDRTKVSVTQSNFPVLIQRTDTEWKDTGNGGNAGRTDGYDFVFTDSNGTTLLNYEIEKYSASTGELVAWVSVPSVSSSVDTDIYIYYGNVSATNQQNATAVWDSNFKMVQHANGSGQANDSTANANNATVIGDPFESYSITSTSPHTGSHQGVATDGTNYYTIDTDSITKYNSSWTQTAQLLNANQSIGVNTTNHLSDGDYYNGKLYLPVENYVHPCISQTDDYIAIWNASDLSFDTKFDVSGLGFGSSGLTIDPTAGDNGIIYNVSYCDGTKIWKLDLSTGAYLGAITLSQTISNSQGISLKDGYFYINDDLNDVVWKVAQDGTVLNSVLSYPHVASGSLEGLDYSTNKLLVLVDQGVSDRKVYTFEKTPLTKLGPALDFKKSEVLSIPYTLPDSGTISFWYNPKTYFYNFHSLLDNSVSDNDWELWVDNTGYVNFRVKSNETSVKYDLGDNVTQVGLNTWFNIVIKWQKGGNKYLLVNGVQRGTNSIASTWVDPGTTTYVGGGNSGNLKDNGYFDEIRISDTVRSNNWLLTEYNNQSSPDTFYSVSSQESPTFDSGNPTVQPNSSIAYSGLSSFTETATKNSGETKYQISNNAGTTWYWWNGSSWAATSSDYSEANTANDVNSHISTFPSGNGQFLFKAYLHSDGAQLVQLDTVSFDDDATAPILSSVASTPSSTSSIITWTTDEDASSKVDYGLTNSYGDTTSESDTSPRVTNHSVSLSELTACTTYHYRVRSKDAALNETIGSDNTFTTTGCTGSASVDSQTSSTITTASGGSINLLSDGKGITLTIPTSFAGSDANFQVKQLDKTTVTNLTSTPTGYLTIGSYIYDLKALSDVSTIISSFNNAITVAVAYGSSDMTGIDESSLKIYRWDGGSWHELSGCAVDTSAKTVTCTTTNFSVFGLFGTATTASASSGRSSSGGIHYGCKDPKALNYEYFAANKPELCKYSIIRNPTTPGVLSNYHFSRSLQLGSTGDDVKELQKYLNKNGYVVALSGPGSVDNETTIFGRATRATLIKFQTANNISPALGYFGPITRTFIENTGNQVNPNLKVTDQVSTTTPVTQFTRDLEFGMSGDDVKALQQILISKDSGPSAKALADNGTTTYFGNLTKQAVIEFQKANNIIPTAGYFGIKTRTLVGQ